MLDYSLNLATGEYRKNDGKNAQADYDAARAEYVSRHPRPTPRLQANFDVPVCDKDGNQIVDEHGELLFEKQVSKTDQSLKAQCDLPSLIKNATATELRLWLSEYNEWLANAHDIELTTLTLAEQKMVIDEASYAFLALPSEVRAEYDNSVEKFMDFVISDPDSHTQLQELLTGVHIQETKPDVQTIVSNKTQNPAESQQAETTPETPAEIPAKQ